MLIQIIGYSYVTLTTPFIDESDMRNCVVWDRRFNLHYEEQFAILDSIVSQTISYSLSKFLLHQSLNMTLGYQDE